MTVEGVCWRHKLENDMTFEAMPCFATMPFANAAQRHLALCVASWSQELQARDRGGGAFCSAALQRSQGVLPTFWRNHGIVELAVISCAETERRVFGRMGEAKWALIDIVGAPVFVEQGRARLITSGSLAMTAGCRQIMI